MIVKDRKGNEKSLYDMLKCLHINTGTFSNYPLAGITLKSFERFLSKIDTANGELNEQITFNLDMDKIRKYAVLTFFGVNENSKKVPVKICFINWGEYNKKLWDSYVLYCLKLFKKENEIKEMDGLFLAYIDFIATSDQSDKFSKLHDEMIDFCMAILNYNSVI